ncbi:RagB/SusD family nutrient uptake outer membrane protein [Hymenobacter psoromatis]|uniref:RagB/SusD family nutrient uptake outer membrane protein n=1 Tax=Hymenobacter psoromatis TaxID=1484116 RepID=UPI001CBD402A|nr:RagB/SusD family nutrient uptake outer membrane protein [Hymenobacter psoromatis]
MHTFNKLLLGAGAALLLTATGCKKTLDEVPYDFYAPENVYKSADDAEAAIAGVYSDFNSYDWFTKPYWEFLSEDDDHIAGASFALTGIGSGNYLGDYKTPIMFTGPYAVIARANTVLERVPAITMDKTQQNRILGEAHFLRAFSYFTLVKLFGPVPLRTASVTSITDTNIPRSSVSDVYKQIIDDLQQGETLMPYQGDPGSGALGHVNKGAAQGLLAKVYATIGSASLKGAQMTVQGGKDNGFYTYNKDVVAGYEGFDSKQYYQLAKDEAGKLITSGKYSLFPNYMDLWKKSNDNLVEHMFMEQTLAGNTIHSNFVNNYFTSGDLGGRGYLWMDTNFYQQFSPLDDRITKDVTHFWFEDYGNGPFYYFYPRTDSLKYYIVSVNTKTGAKPAKGDTTFARYQNKAQILKYYVPGKPIAPNNSDGNFGATNYPLLRYADVLLVYAEAENELNGNTPDARKYYLQVRVRSNQTATAAQDPLLDPSNLNQLQMRSAIFAERGQELAFESDRRYDLQRWGVYLQTMNQIGLSKQNVLKSRDQRTLLVPLPVAEVLANPSVTQNAGW